jgi:hypothetical protein
MSVTRVAGIDPGSKTGVVILELPTSVRDLSRAVWVHSASISGMAETLSRTRAEGHALLFSRVRELLADHDVRDVALECPVDALPSWGAATGRKSNPATLFSLGANYGLCLAAAHAAGASKIMSYRVKPTRERPAGWMPMVREPSRRNPNVMVTHVQSRDITLEQLRQLCFLHWPADVYQDGVRIACAARDIGEDELMALGVLRYHLQRTPLPPTP